ncbi:MAG: iditol 2-dehydrogenase, partial [Candidatus Rokuibacteriota bacterium]
ETAMDCTGLPEPRVAAVKSTATWGRMCFVGEGGATTFDISRDLIRKQLTLMASWTFSSMGQWECARFVADRKIPLGRLLTNRFTIDQAAEAYKLFDTQTTGKGVFTAF